MQPCSNAAAGLLQKSHLGAEKPCKSGNVDTCSHVKGTVSWLVLTGFMASVMASSSFETGQFLLTTDVCAAFLNTYSDSFLMENCDFIELQY